MFAREGAKLVLAHVQEEGLQETLAGVREAGGEAVIEPVDVSVDSGKLKGLIDLGLSTYGRIDILINNAGITGQMTGLEEQDGEDWKKVLEVNLLARSRDQARSPAHAGAGLRGHRQDGLGGRIVRGRGERLQRQQGGPDQLHPDGGLRPGGSNVRVNAGSPRAHRNRDDQAGLRLRPFRGQGGQAGQPLRVAALRSAGTKIAAAILFLASEEASFVTGQALAVDGGNTASLNLPGMKF